MLKRNSGSFKSLGGRIDSIFIYCFGGGEEIRGAPHAFTPSLTQKVHQLLEENEQ